MTTSRPPLRTVVLSHQAQGAYDEAQAKFHRFDEAFQGLEWRIARDPSAHAVHRYSERYECIVYLQVQEAVWYLDVPSLWVLYTFDDNTVDILNLNVLPE